MAPASFWHHIPQPIIGLSPMDGVTNPAFRFIVPRYGEPDVEVTEFVNVDEVCHGGEAAWRQLQYAEIERPVVAQIYGADPDTFFQVAQVVCELGFVGVDINMGCPSKNVSARGCGGEVQPVQDVRDLNYHHPIDGGGLKSARAPHQAVRRSGAPTQFGLCPSSPEGAQPAEPPHIVLSDQPLHRPIAIREAMSTPSNGSPGEGRVRE